MCANIVDEMRANYCCHYQYKVRESSVVDKMANEVDKICANIVDERCADELSHNKYQVRETLAIQETIALQTIRKTHHPKTRVEVVAL